MSHEDRVDLLGYADDGLQEEIPSGVDRRTFLMRSAVVGATAVITGKSISAQERTERSTAAPPLSEDLNVAKQAKGPVMTTIDEFYKVGPGPSSSHTIGPMRITYDFYQRCTKLPADELAKATAMQVNLFGSLSATGKGHGTERAALAGLVGHEPATIDPGAVKARTAFAIASNEIERHHRVSFDATVAAMAQTAKDMNSKYKETSEAGLALSVVLC